MAADVARFRPVHPADSALVAALNGACFEEAWTVAAVGTLLGVRSTWGVLVFVDTDGGPDPVGYCLARSAQDEIEILSFGILPGYRRRGFGRALLKAVAEQARSRGAGQIFLEVADDNAGGLALYAGAGFLRVGRRPKYYRRSQTGRIDAVVMCLDLATYTLTEESNSGK